MTRAGTNLGQYRILHRIGAGGMAEVFLAQKIGAAGFSRNVAIKTITAAGAATESISLFLDEARVASGLQHSAIVQTLDLGFEQDTLFIVMEYVPGPPMSRVIYELKQRGRFMPPHMAAYIGARVANALDYAHRRVTTASGQPLALVHRDVSPQNILLTRNGMPKLTDFGVARASIQMHKTRTGQVRGKAAYMAPEQVRAHALDGRTDMFALALVLYEALTCFRPYQRKTDILSMRAIISEDVPPLRERNPTVPPDLNAVLMRALAKKPADRYATCGEFEQALRATLKDLRESSIEEETGRMLIELFGPEQWSSDDPMTLEPWQPTIAIAGQDTGAAPPRVISPEVAALIGQTPMGRSISGLTPQTPNHGEAAEADPRAEDVAANPPGSTRVLARDNGQGQPAARPATGEARPPTVTKNPPMLDGAAVGSQGAAMGPGTGAPLGTRTHPGASRSDPPPQTFSAPGTGSVRLPTGSGAFGPSISSPVSVESHRLLSEVPMTPPMSSSGATYGGRSHEQLQIATSRSKLFAPFAVGALLLIGGLIGAAVTSIARDDTQAARPAQGPANDMPAEPRAVSQPQGGGAAPSPAPAPGESSGETTAAAAGAPSGPPAPSGAETPREVKRADPERRKAKVSPPKTAQIVDKEEAARSAPPPPAPSLSFERVMKLIAKAGARPDLKKDLMRVANDVSLGKKIEASDVELVRRAESELGP